MTPVALAASRELDARLDGALVTPDHDSWDSARQAWNLAVDQHNAGALGSLEGAIIVRTSAMRGVSIDPERRIARVRAGTLWDEVMGPATTDPGTTYAADAYRRLQEIRRHVDPDGVFQANHRSDVTA